MPDLDAAFTRLRHRINRASGQYARHARNEITESVKAARESIDRMYAEATADAGNEIATHTDDRKET